MADFTGQNIQDTYQRVVQVDGNQLQDGTGSVLPISFDGNDVVIPGALRAESYIVSQSTTIATSGSTIFGNSHDDTHKFSGSVNIGDKVNTDYNTITPALFVRQDAVDRSQIANGFGGSIDFHIQRGANANGARSGRIANRLTTGAQGSSDFYALDFGIRSNDTQIDLMTLHSDSSNTAGRVGILDTTPSYTLDVNGTFRTTGNAILGNASSDSHTINGSISNVNTTHVTASGQISASNTVTGQTLKSSTGNIIGDESFSTQLVVNGPITSSAISASGYVYAERVFLNNNDTLRYSTANSGLYVNGGIQTIGNSTFGNANNDTHTFTGNITASGNISASGTIVGSNLSGTNTGDQDLSSLALKTAVSGAFVAPSASFSTRVTANDAKVSYTNAAVTTVINDAGILSSSFQIATEISGAFVAPSASFSTRVTTNDAKVSYTDAAVTTVINTAGVLSSSAQIDSDISGSLGANASLIRSLTAASISGSVTTVSSSLANRTTTLESTTANRTFNHVTASGAISASGTVEASGYKGTKHLLPGFGKVYINDDPFVQNSVYFGHSTGNQPYNWNDPQAAGGTLGSTSTITIAEDDFRWGHILPFDVSEVEIQCSLRPGGACTGDNFFIGLYSAARPDAAAAANLDITLLAHNDDTFSQGKYTTNDFTYTGDLTKGTIIFVGIGSEDATAAKNAPGLINVIVTQR